MSDHPHRARQKALGIHVELGKEAVKPDDRNVQAAAYLQPKKVLPAAPRYIQWTRRLSRHPFPMYANDELPDCTAAAIGHAVRVFSYNARHPEDPTDADVLTLFDATGPRNRGRIMLDMLNVWRKQGFRGETITGFVQVNPQKLDEVKAAAWLFGGLYVGLALPNSAKNQRHWKVVPGADGEPGSWGGHAVWVPDVLSKDIRCITWGERLTMSQGFLRTYADECYAVVSSEWVTEAMKAPSGFQLQALLDDLSQFS